MSEAHSAGGIGQRKAQHLEICLEEGSYAVENGNSLLGDVTLLHRALPELNADAIDTGTEFLHSRISLPVFISSMTGGSAGAYKANKDLARVAQEAGIPVGMGSIRILFRNPDVMDHFALKQIARDVPVFANIGGVQLRLGARDEVGDRFENLIELIKRLEVDAIAVHLNPGQELAQPEGDRDFTGILAGIHELAERCPVPLIVKETGCGIAPDEAAAIIDAGAGYVDIAGSGGTNWMTVEGFRLDNTARAVADEFAGWGIPTAAALNAIRQSQSSLTGRVLASGGVRTGLDVAKCIALGATATGLALPFIRAVAGGGVDAGLATVNQLNAALRDVMALTGSTSVAELQHAPLIVSAGLKDYTEGLSRLQRI